MSVAIGIPKLKACAADDDDRDAVVAAPIEDLLADGDGCSWHYLGKRLSKSTKNTRGPIARRARTT